MIFIISDTHFFHDKMVEYCGRPINHTEIIKNNLLSVPFTKNDVLIHLGDICIGHDQEVHDTIIKPLPCKKWLTRGNHDKKTDSWYLENGWDWVGSQFTKVCFGKVIVFSHVPVRWDGIYDLNIHGHFHNNDHRSLEPELVAIRNERHRLLSIEKMHYKVVSLEMFLKMTPPTLK